MIYFLYGEDTYRARDKLKEIIKGYEKIHKSGLSLKFWDFSDRNQKINFSDLKDSFRQTSMFKEKKLIVLVNPFLDSGFKNTFLKEAENFLKSEDIIIFYQKGRVDERDGLFKFLKNNAKCQKFDLLAAIKLKNWIKKEFENYKAKYDPAVIDKIIAYASNDLWRLNNEIKKIALYKKGKKITLEDVELLIKPDIETDIFKTIDAIALKNKKEALKLLHKHIEKGDSPLYLLSMINYQFRNILIIKDLMERRYTFPAIIKKSGLHPFVAQKNYFQSQKFSFNDLKKIYQKILKVDLDIKTGKIEPEMALELLISEI